MNLKVIFYYMKQVYEEKFFIEKIQYLTNLSIFELE